MLGVRAYVLTDENRLYINALKRTEILRGKFERDRLWPGADINILIENLKELRHFWNQAYPEEVFIHRHRGLVVD